MTVAGILEPDLGLGGSLLSMITRVPQFLVTLTGYCDIRISQSHCGDSWFKCQVREYSQSVKIPGQVGNSSESCLSVVIVNIEEA